MKLRKIAKACILSLALVAGIAAIPQKAMAASDTMKYKGHKYQVFVAAETITWKEAKAKCKAKGGHLVTISDENEDAKVFRLIHDYGYDEAWIGLENVGTAGDMDWKWVNGEKFKYANWAPYQPDCMYGTEFYAGYINTYPGTWNDFENDYGMYAYVCEWDESLTLSDKELTLTPGEGSILTYTYTNNGKEQNKKAKFKSSKPSVVKVSSTGKVVAVAPGSATITVKAGNAVATCKVIVKPDQVKNVKAITRNKNSVQLQWKDQKGISFYEVHMYDRDLEEYTKIKNVKGSMNMATIQGLKKGTTYKFKIRAYVKVGSKKYYGSFSKELKVTTKK